MIFGRFVRRPQTVWTRRALFQIHLWTGIGVGLYILMISVSGSAIVFRREITRLAWKAPAVTPTGRLMTVEELSAAAKKVYPRFETFRIAFSKDPARAAVVTMTRAQRTRERAFDPYTGKDLADVGPMSRSSSTGSSNCTTICLPTRPAASSMAPAPCCSPFCASRCVVIWWPGTTRWRSLFVWRKVGWKRFNWDLHSAIGFWMFLFVLMWGISGIYLSYADPFVKLVDFLQPPDPNSTVPRSGDDFLAWLARIHFGRAYGTSVKWLYVVLGLVPAVLFGTGGIMWWNRVLRPAMRKRAHPAVEIAEPEVSGVQPPDFTLET